jgi:hypothetical protein
VIFIDKGKNYIGKVSPRRNLESSLKRERGKNYSGKECGT